MTEMLQIRSAERYFEEYGRNGIGKGADKWMIRRQLIDAFHKEIFGLVAMRAKKNFKDIPPEGDPEAMQIVKNVVKDTQRKWVKLCGIFAKYKETSNLLELNDLQMDESDIMRDVMEKNTLGTEDILQHPEVEPTFYRESLENGVEPVYEEEDG